MKSSSHVSKFRLWILAAASLGGLTVFALSGGTAAVAASGSVGYTTTVSTGVSMLAGTTDIGNHCNEDNGGPCLTPVTLPFSVPFYGVNYRSVQVGTSGDILFTGSDPTNYYGCLPTSNLGATLAVNYTYWMETEDPGVTDLGIYTATYGTAPHRTFVVEWKSDLYDENYEDPYAKWDFEAQFTEGSPVIKVVFGDSWENYTTDNGNTWTRVDPAIWGGATGVQNGTGSSTGGCGTTPASGQAISFTPTTTAPSTVEENSSTIVYTKAWALGNCGSAFCSPDNKQKNSTTSGAQATLTYTGKSADWIASTGPNGGKVGVYVDGTLKTTVNLHSSAIVDGITAYTGPTLKSGTHTLTLKRVSGRINVDAFRVH